MPVSDCYQTQPDGYVRFGIHGKPLEGEFYRYDLFGCDLGPTVGYIRPFNKILRQELIDCLQSVQSRDLINFVANDEVITCDAYVTDKQIQGGYQLLIEHFDFIDESDLSTDRKEISSCRVDLLQRQYILASNKNENKEVLNNIDKEFHRWVTPFCIPLRYERTWKTKNKNKIYSSILIVILALIAYVAF